MVCHEQYAKAWMPNAFLSYLHAVIFMVRESSTGKFLNWVSVIVNVIVGGQRGSSDEMVFINPS